VVSGYWVDFHILKINTGEPKMSSKENYIERRKEPRYNILADAKVKTPETTLTAAVKNISGGGMEIHLQKSVNPRTLLSVSLQLDVEYVFHGSVVWTLGNYVNHQWLYRVGIKTMDIVSENCTAKSSQEKRDLVLSILPYMNVVNED
jgi:hypothetical protein